MTTERSGSNPPGAGPPTTPVTPRTGVVPIPENRAFPRAAPELLDRAGISRDRAGAMIELGSGLMEYRPMMAPDRVEKIRAWHQASLSLGAEEGKAGQSFDYLGRTIVVPPEVMPITGASHLLGTAVLAEVRATDRVLDMGTGSGVNAILAAGTAGSVLAVDINPVALEAARANAERNGVADRIEVRHSDVFSTVDGVFDLIVFDPPFRWFTPANLLELAMTDGNYRALTEFFRDVSGHLAPGGRLLIFFGTSGDLDYLNRLADEAGFVREVVATDGMERDGMRVDYFTYRMTKAA